MTGMQECLVAFLDILGFKELTRRCNDDSSLQDRLLIALKEAYQVPRFTHVSLSDKPGQSGLWTLQMQVVSDTVILFIPAMNDGAANLLNSVRVLHDRLFDNRVLLRGAITIGSMYWDDTWSSASDLRHQPRQTIAFGPGLIDAHEMESKLAVYPRILLSDRFLDHVADESLNKSPNCLCHGRIPDVFRLCEDGLHHFDVLHPKIKRETRREVSHDTAHSGDEAPDLAAMPHRDYISNYRSGLAELLNEETPRVRAKLHWLASYFNTTVTRLPYGAPLHIDAKHVAADDTVESKALQDIT